MEVENPEKVDKADSEFTLVNYYSWRSFYLSIGMSITLLLFSATIFIGFDLKYVAAIFLASMSIVIFLLMIREWKTSTTIFVSSEKIIFRSEELIPSEIEEFIFINWIVDIKRKNGIRSHIRVAVKNNEELETLKSRIIEYGNHYNIRVRREW